MIAQEIVDELQKIASEERRKISDVVEEILKIAMWGDVVYLDCKEWDKLRNKHGWRDACGLIKECIRRLNSHA
jgi:hypothetical protein